MNNKILISGIQNHIKDFNGQQVKAFYETELGFTDVFTEEDNYMDYFKSDEYLERHIEGNEEEIRKKLVNLHIEVSDNQEDKEIEFMAEKLTAIDLDALPIKTEFVERVKIMLEEAINMAEHKSNLGVIIFIGSILEGVILGMLKNGTETNQLQRDFKDSANNPPKKNGTIKEFEDWEFINYLQMAKKVGMYMDKEDHKANLIREARNFVHPNEQIKRQSFSINDALQSVLMLCEIIESFKHYGKYKR